MLRCYTFSIVLFIPTVELAQLDTRCRYYSLWTTVEQTFLQSEISELQFSRRVSKSVFGVAVNDPLFVAMNDFEKLLPILKCT